VIWPRIESSQHNDKVATAGEMAWPVRCSDVNDQVDVNLIYNVTYFMSYNSSYLKSYTTYRVCILSDKYHLLL
jgi:hypothetical protein